MTAILLPQAAIAFIQDDTNGIRQPLVTGLPGTPARTCTWTPDLSAAEQTIVDDIAAMTRGNITGLSLAEYQALKPDLAGLRTYQGIASPTLAQTVSAVKAQSRVLRALLRDG